MSNRVLTGRDQNFPDEYIRGQVEILSVTVSQRADLENSDGPRGGLCPADGQATRRLLFQIFERLLLADDFGVRRCISRLEPVDSILQK
jgi:hypothetical protein